MNNKPTCKTYPSGTKAWVLLNNQFHREDGPAVEYADGSKSWYLNDKRHREDGPAVERADGYKAWYLNGEQYTEQEYWQELYKRGIITEEKAFLELV